MSHEVIRAPFDYSDWDVALRSSDRVLFRLHKIILRKASPIFEDMFSLPIDPNDNAAGELQTIDMTENANTIERLLRLCYPVPEPVITNTPINELVALLEAMRKYEMQDFTSAVEQQLLIRLESKTVESLRAYAIAYLYKMRRLAEAAARTLLDHGALEPTSMPPEYSTIPASAIWVLARYRRECRKVVDIILDNNVECWTSRGSLLSPRGNVSNVKRSWVWVECPNRAHRSSGATHETTTRMKISEWWFTYKTAAKEALEVSPRGEVVTRLSVLQPAIEQAQASGCPRCSKGAWKDLTEFSQLLATEIDQRMSSVSSTSVLNEFSGDEPPHFVFPTTY